MKLTNVLVKAILGILPIGTFAGTEARAGLLGDYASAEVASAEVAPAEVAPAEVHTWHHISVNQEASCQLGQAFENKYSFVDGNNTPIQIAKRFTVKPGDNFTYGFEFEDGADFNLIYTLACVVNN